jgi:hypothetical protein
MVVDGTRQKTGGRRNVPHRATVIPARAEKLGGFFEDFGAAIIANGIEWQEHTPYQTSVWLIPY